MLYPSLAAYLCVYHTVDIARVLACVRAVLLVTRSELYYNHYVSLIPYLAHFTPHTEVATGASSAAGKGIGETLGP